MPCALKPPLCRHHVTDEERAALEAGLRRSRCAAARSGSRALSDSPSQARRCWMPSSAWASRGDVPHTRSGVPTRQTSEHNRRDRRLHSAAHHQDMALGFAPEGWWSREAQPHRQAGSDGTPIRLVETTVPAKDPAGHAIAGAGCDGPTAHHWLWRVGQEQPVRADTLRAWRAPYCTAQAKRSRLRIWDQASWHVSQAGQEGSNAPHRQANQAGGSRVMLCRFPRQRLWPHPREPTWVHGKRAVVAPARGLSTAELRQRV